jgi:hypothetical protein
MRKQDEWWRRTSCSDPWSTGDNVKPLAPRAKLGGSRPHAAGRARTTAAALHAPFPAALL